MHALSGCDTVSFFNGIGKKTALDIWRSLPNLILSSLPNSSEDY